MHRVGGSRRPRRALGRWRAMTTIEVVVAMGIVGLIATIAVVSFRSTQSNAKDQAAVEVVRSMALDAQQLAATASRGAFSTQDLQAALDALAPTQSAAGVVSAVGVAAASTFSLVDTASLAYGQVSTALGGQDQATVVGIAMESLTGNCSWALAPVRGQVTAGVWSGDLGDACRGSAVLTSTSTPDPEPTGPPPTPTLSSCVPHDISAIVSWTSVSASDLAGYRVYQDDQLVRSVAITPTSTTITPLVNETTYRFQVASVDRAGNASARSNSVTCTPLDDSAPTVPTLIATGGDRLVALDWDDSLDSAPVGYRVYRDGVLIAQTSTSALSDADRALVVGRTYSYYVVAFDTVGNSSARSNTASATPYDRTPPPVPANLAVSSNEVKKVTVTFDPVVSDVGDLSGYRLYRVTNTGPNQVASLVTQGDTAAFPSGGNPDRLGLVYSGPAGTPLGNGETVTFAVSSYDTLGNESSRSPDASGTTLPVPAVPVPTTQGALDSITVSWPTVTAAATYDVQRRTGPNAYATISIAQAVTSYVDSAVTAGMTYDYQVRACNAAGCSAYASTSGATAPDPPSLTAVANGYGATLNWNAPTGAATYAVQRAVSNAAYTALTTGLTAITYADISPPLAANTTYDYQVRACTSAGACGSWSTPASVTTAPASPMPTATPDIRQVSLAWPTVPGAARYSVARRTGTNSFTDLTTTLTAATYLDTTATGDNTTYDYQVRACSASGCSAPGTVSATTAPAAPPLALTVSQYTITPAWTPTPAGAARYELQRAVGTGAWATVSTTLTTTSYVDANLAAGTNHNYQLRACNSANLCGTWTAKSALTVPAVPTTSISYQSGTSITASWDLPTSTTSSVSRRNGASTVTVNAPTKTRADTNLTKATVYSYDTQSCNASGCSPWSASVSAATIPNTPTITGGCDPYGGPNVGSMNGYCTFYWDFQTGATSYAGKWWNSGCPDVNVCAPAWQLTGNFNGIGPLQGYLGYGNLFTISVCNAAGCAANSTRPIAFPRPTRSDSSTLELRGCPGDGWCYMRSSAYWATSFEVGWQNGDLYGYYVYCTPGCWAWTGDNTIWTEYPAQGNNVHLATQGCRNTYGYTPTGFGKCYGYISVHLWPALPYGVYIQWMAMSSNDYYCHPPAPNIPPYYLCHDWYSVYQF